MADAPSGLGLRIGIKRVICYSWKLFRAVAFDAVLLMGRNQKKSASVFIRLQI